ncbi:hypothetical protein HMPREF9013_1062 [Bulleidia extructa W1219]|uniref:Bacterial toxin 37 domain-containing protein n=1 Tax=Bulleidia extructa W1219 TaxID=679192 RepID=D2MMS8_9FIRM|nr:hypothetical protein [Bulleidia extructa]EFC06354.1 hypothetical protein HMPREF9013_1062 [Bulleidia extructa W1219]
MKKILSVFLSILVIIHFVVPVNVKATNSFKTNQLNNIEDYKITKDSITISGVTISKSEFLEIIKSPSRQHDRAYDGANSSSSSKKTGDLTSRITPFNETIGIYEFDLGVAAKLELLGAGLSEAYEKVTYALLLTTIAYTTWELDYNGFEILVNVTPKGLKLNGVSFGYSWATKEAVKALSKNKDQPIKENEVKSPEDNRDVGNGHTVPDYPGNDPNVSPGEGWKWRGNDVPDTGKGAWRKEETGENLHPDLKHGKPYGLHWDYNYDGSGNHGYRIFPDNSFQKKS